MDALRLGSAVRAVRLRKGWRQADVAAAARVSIATVSRVERGSLEPISVGMLLRVAAAMQIRIDWTPRWRGGELDRMLMQATRPCTRQRLASSVAPVG